MAGYKIHLPKTTKIVKGKITSRTRRAPAGQSRNQANKAARLAKAWVEKSKR